MAQVSDRTVVRVEGRHAVCAGLRLLADHLEAGHVTAFSLELSPAGTARLSVCYQHGAAAPVELPGVHQELDEVPERGDA